MKEKKLQIFVSSTFTDLKEERQAAVEAILSSGHIPAGMELFSAGDESQMTVIERWIDESDIYLLILGGRYGSIEPKSGKSYTHLEFEYAISKNKPLFAVVISENALEEKIKKIGSSVIEKDSQKELREFRELVLKNLVKFWDDKKDIKIAIHETLSEFSFRKELIGWIRGDNSVNTAFLAEEIASLTKENSELRNKINNISSNQPLYSSLTYEELEKLLKKEKFSKEKDDITLFDFFIAHAPILKSNVYAHNVGDDVWNAIKALEIFKVVERHSNSMSIYYLLTRDGHNFYLKSKSLMNED